MTLDERARLGRRHTSPPRRSRASPETTVEVADVGDFEQGPGVLLRRLGEASQARHDRRGRRPHGRRATTIRGWDLWVEKRPRRHAHHQQVAAATRSRSSSQDRAQARASGTTCSSPTTARARRPASKIYVNGVPQEADVAGRLARRARSAPRCRLKIGQRHTQRRGWMTSVLQDLRIYGRALSASRSRAAGHGHARGLAGRQAGRRAQPPRRTNELFDWWLADDGPGISAVCRPKLSELEAGGGGHQGAGHDRPRDAGADRARRWPTSSSAASTTSAATRSSRTRPASCRRCRPNLPRNRLGLRPVAAAAGASADGPRHGQPLLAGGVRHRPRAAPAATSASPASCRRTPSCSTGWRSSSASRAGT